MKISLRTKALLSGAIISGAILFAAVTAPADTFYLARNEFTGGNPGTATNNWFGPIWTNAVTPVPVAAVAGNDYIVAMIGTANGAVRTTNTAIVPQAFPGDTLLVSNGCALYLKNAGTNCDANIVLDGGQIIEHGTASPTSPVWLGGTLQVNPSTNTLGVQGSYSGGNYFNLGSDQGGGNHDIWLQANMSGSGSIIMNMLPNTPNTLALFGTNTAFSGAWTNNNGTIEIESGSVDALGSGPVIMTFGGTTFLSFNSTSDLVISNPIFGNGAVIKLNTNTVTLSATNTYIGATIISNGVLRIGAGFGITNTSRISLEGGTLDASLIGGLTLATYNNQQMDGNGTLISNLTASTGNTLNFNLSPSTNDVLNVTGSLTLNGNPTLALTASGFIPSGTYRLINYNGTIQGGGSFTLVPPAGSSEMFALDTSTPGQVNLNVTGTQRHLTWQGNSSSTWDTSAANWIGDSTVYAVGDNVTFDDTANPSSTFVRIANSTLYPGAMTVNNTSKQYVFYGSSPSVGITCSGTLTKAGANELDFISSGNNFSGPIVIQAGILSVGNGSDYGSLVPGAVTSNSITNNGVLRVNMDANAVAFNMPISGSGAFEVTGGGVTVTIGGNGHNSYTGLTTIGDGCQLNIATANALGSTSSGTIVQANGRLGVASFVGSMSVAEPLTISGTGISGAPGALYVNTSGNNVTWAGPVTIAGNSQVRAINANVRMNFSNTVLGTNVALECTAGNVASPITDGSVIIDFENTLSLGGSGSLLADGPGTVFLNGNNVWGGGTTVTRGTLRVGGTLNGGNVTVNPGANTATLAGSGTIMGLVTVMANGTLAPGDYSAIGTLTVNNSVTLSGATVMRLDRNNAQNADLLAASSVTFGGTLTVTNIGDSLQAGDTFQLFSGSISGTFTTVNLPSLPSPLFWDTSLLGSGMISVGSPAPITGQPKIANGTNFVWSTTSALGSNYVLQATSSLNPPITWTDIITKAGTGGTLNFTNPITAGFPQRFFRLKVQ